MKKKDICYCVDENYFKQFIISLISLIENNPKEQLRIHVLFDEISKKEENALLNIKREYNINLKQYRIKKNDLKNLKINKHFSLANYYRLLIPSILPQKIKKILYLDFRFNYKKRYPGII